MLSAWVVSPFWEGVLRHHCSTMPALTFFLPYLAWDIAVDFLAQRTRAAAILIESQTRAVAAAAVFLLQGGAWAMSFGIVACQQVGRIAEWLG